VTHDPLRTAARESEKRTLATKIRLKRMGKKKRPFYRVVVADSAKPRDGRAIDNQGHYDPMTDPATVEIDADKAMLWLDRGAQPTETVRSLLRRAGVLKQRHERGAAPAAEAEAEAEPDGALALTMNDE
jgi:small subunit ribosomal protein S16